MRKSTAYEGARFRKTPTIASCAVVSLIAFGMTAGSVPAAADEAVSGGVWQFSATGTTQSFTVPADVTALTAVVVGAAGQAASSEAGPGGSGMTISTHIVKPGDVWTVWVGSAGEDSGGWGFACGGSRGDGRFPGFNGGGGGGASAITAGFFSDDGCDNRPAADSILAVAGGGGGGGGDGAEPLMHGWGFKVVKGGAGGDGGNPAGAGEPNSVGASGGCGGCAGHPNGKNGVETPTLGGGSGGGGGGYPQGGGSERPYYGGTGGGGGSSFIHSNAERTHFGPGTGAGNGSVMLFAGTSALYGCSGFLIGVDVPNDAGAVHVRAVGAQGGTRGVGDGGAGGIGGAVEALYSVTPDAKPLATVGCQNPGDGTGGWGYNIGGRKGIAKDIEGLDGGDGGGSTFVQFSSDSWVVAGGGGGGGGNGGIVGGPGQGSIGGDGGTEGGDGAHGGGTGGGAGCGSCVNAPDAPRGEDSSNGTLGGGGGGGGGGWLNGAGGGGGDLNPGVTGGGGGGGGGGSSFISSNAEDYAYVEATGGDGSLLLLWYTNVANTLSAYGGSKQQAQIHFPFAAPLAVKVTDITGRPVEGITVDFTLAGTGAAGGMFQDMSQTGSAVSDENGIATTSQIFANSTPGPWQALATVSGLNSHALFSLTNERLATSVALAVAPAAVTPTETVTVTATVSANDSFFGTPTGDVIFDVAGTSHTVPLTDGKAELPLTDLAVGSEQITATYAGSAEHARSTAVTTIDIEPTPTSLKVESSHNPAPGGEPLSFTATMSVPAGNTVCSGCEVHFTANPGDTALGTVTTNDSGVATLESVTWGQSDGPNTITASFAGNGTYAAATGSMVQTIDDGTALSVTATPSISEYGDSVEITATIEPVTEPYATGAVELDYDEGGTQKMFCSLGFDQTSQNVVNCPAYSEFPVGTTTIDTWYSGDSNHSQVYGSISHTVTKAATTSTVSFTHVEGEPGVFDLHATVARSTGTAPLLPTGTVQFLLNGSPLGDPQPLPADGVLDGGQASALPGQYTLTAQYSGDANYAPSKANIPITFPKLAATISLDTSPRASLVGDSVELSAEVSSDTGRRPEGFIQFRVDGVVYGDPVPIAGGVATSIGLTELTADHHHVTATYLSTSGHHSAWSVRGHEVSQPTVLLIGRPAATIHENTPVEFKAHVTPIARGGSIQFSVDGVPIPGCSEVDPDDGRCTVALPRGSHTVTAAYSGAPGTEPSIAHLQVTVSASDTTPASIAVTGIDAAWIAIGGAAVLLIGLLALLLAWSRRQRRDLGSDALEQREGEEPQAQQ